MHFIRGLCFVVAMMVATVAKAQDNFSVRGDPNGSFATEIELYNAFSERVNEIAEEILAPMIGNGQIIRPIFSIEGEETQFYIWITHIIGDTVASFGFAEGDFEDLGEALDFLVFSGIEEGIDNLFSALHFTQQNVNEILVAETPTNPVAGNPASLQSGMISSDFQIGTVIGNQPNFGSAGAGGSTTPNLIGAGANTGRLSGAGVDIEFLELPFSYAFALDDPRYAVLIDVPFRMTSYNGQKAYTASVGVGIRLPITDNWAVTPLGRLGLALTENSGTNGFLYSLSVVSDYSMDIRGLSVSLGNQVSHIRTLPVGPQNYTLQNTVVKNGIGFGGNTPLKLFDQQLTWATSVANTRFFGDQLFIDSMTDVAVSLGTTKSANGNRWDSMRLGLTYSFGGDDLEGLELNFGYRF